MHEQAPRWELWLLTALSVCVFGYCLRVGKVGSRFSRSITTRAKDPFNYWLSMFFIGVMGAYFFYLSLR